MSNLITVEKPPKSSVVYVVYALDQERVYILSRSVNMLYYVLKSQLEDGSYEPLSNDFYKNWTWQKGDDQKGFFDGVPAHSLLNQISYGKSRPTLFECASPNKLANCTIVPYERIEIDYDILLSLFDDNVPSLDNIKSEYSNLSRAPGSSFGLSISKYVSKFIFVKIDHLAWFGNFEKKYGKTFVETMLSGPMKKDDLKLVKKIAVNIVRAAVAAPPKHGNEISKKIRDIIIEKSVNWQIVMQKHVIVE
jgi:hypothetical protein